MADDHCILVKRYNSDLSCCGIVLDSINGIVLTVGSLFTDLLPQIETQRPFSADCPLLSQDDFAETSLNGRIAVDVLIRRSGQEAFRTLHGCVVLLWRDKGLHRIAERVFPPSEWKFESLSPASELKSTEMTGERTGNEVRALSDFALIRVENLKNHLSCNPLNLSTWRGYENLKKGDTVFVVGTPFGCECPPVFYNSVSKGIVSNLMGANNELIITDARCIPGSEGCAMYMNNPQLGSMKPGLIPHSIILAPFCWRDGEWIGITVACSLEYLLNNLRKLIVTKFRVIPQDFQVLLGMLNLEAKLQYQPGGIDVEVGKENHDRNSLVMQSTESNLNACSIVQTAFAGVVMVQCGRTWGSGIVVDAKEGLIATCSHVIRGHKDSLIARDNRNKTLHLTSMTQNSVTCVFPNGICHNTQVLYATSEGFPLDFALLKTQPYPSRTTLKPRLGTYAAQMKSNNSCNPLYRKGEGVFMVGFPLFSTHQHAEPSVASGVISNIAYADNQEVLLQSSAAVHCGASGGALVSVVTGELLGMVTSHTKDANLSSAFPHVNFSIPANLLYKLVFAVKSGNIQDGLQAFDSDLMESIWKLKNIVYESPQITSKL